MNTSDYSFSCSKCKSNLSIDIDDKHYSVEVDICDRCLAAEREDGHYEGYLERDEECYQEHRTNSFIVVNEDIPVLGKRLSENVYHRLDNMDAVYYDLISEAVQFTLQEWFKKEDV